MSRSSPDLRTTSSLSHLATRPHKTQPSCRLAYALSEHSNLSRRQLLNEATRPDRRSQYPTDAVHLLTHVLTRPRDRNPILSELRRDCYIRQLFLVLPGCGSTAQHVNDSTTLKGLGKQSCLLLERPDAAKMRQVDARTFPLLRKCMPVLQCPCYMLSKILFVLDYSPLSSRLKYGLRPLVSENS